MTLLYCFIYLAFFTGKPIWAFAYKEYEPTGIISMSLTFEQHLVFADQTHQRSCRSMNLMMKSLAPGPGYSTIFALFSFHAQLSTQLFSLVSVKYCNILSVHAFTTHNPNTSLPASYSTFRPWFYNIFMWNIKKM